VGGVLAARIGALGLGGELRHRAGRTGEQPGRQPALEPGAGAAPDRARLPGLSGGAERSPAKHVGPGAAVRVMDLEVSEMFEETGR